MSLQILKKKKKIIAVTSKALFQFIIDSFSNNLSQTINEVKGEKAAELKLLVQYKIIAICVAQINFF